MGFKSYKSLGFQGFVNAGSKIAALAVTPTPTPTPTPTNLTIRTVGGNPNPGYYGICVTDTGVIYATDYYNAAAFKITNGAATKIAGLSQTGYSGDGGLATSAALNAPTGICLDTAGNIYIVDKQNFTVRKINTSGIISVFAGTGTDGFSGDGGLATSAQLNAPIGVCIDTNGNMYIVEKNNRVRKVGTNGIITTIAGTGVAGYSGDGGLATSATFNDSIAICISNTGIIYVAEYGNSIIRKIDTNGVISTFAGIAGTLGFSGDGGLATSAALNGPYAVCVDNVGNVYISDYNNFRIRVVNTSGIISTVAGTGVKGVSGDGGLATSAQINNVRSLCNGANGLIYIAEYSGGRICTLT